MCAETLTENPFPGLRPFELDEACLFFGRDGQSIEVLRRLRSHRFLAVIGTSGSGKSSLIRAGLLVALYGGEMARAGSRWRHAIFRPGNRPIGNLADALGEPGVLGAGATAGAASLDAIWLETTLRSSGRGLADAVRQAHLARQENLLIVVDQMEELFRFQQPSDDLRVADGRREDEAAAFVKLLLEATRQSELPIYVVITMRSDYIGDCARFRGLPEAVNEGLYLIPRMTREQRKEAITGPVAVGGAQITPRLVNRLLNDLGDDPDQLPILQHALMRTWDLWARDGAAGELDLGHYAAIGGMDQALSDHADEAYGELPDDRHREIAKQLFQLLTEKGPDNREARRPACIREIAARTGASLGEILTVIEVFRRPGRSFLTSPAGGTLAADSDIDISHESLIRCWRTLKGWVDEESDSAREFRRLADTAARHAAGRADLLHDPDLAVALKWRQEQRPNAKWAKRYHDSFEPAMAFLDASATARDAALAAAEAKRRAEIHRTRRQLAVTSILAVLALLLACLAGLWAVKFKDQEARSRTLAKGFREEAEKAKHNLVWAIGAEGIANRERAGAEAMAAKADAERKRAERQQERFEQETRLARGDEKQLVEFARDVNSYVEALPEATKMQVEVLKLRENLQQSARRVQQEIIQHDPDNQGALALWADNLATLPDLHRSQGKQVQAERDCAQNLEEADRLGRTPGYLRHALGAYLVAACADTYAQLELKEKALLAADRAVAMAERVWPDAKSADKLNWLMLRSTYSLAGSVHSRYELPRNALVDHRQAVASGRRAVAVTASVFSRKELVEELEIVAKLEAEQEGREKARATYGEACRLAESWAAGPTSDQGLIEIVVDRHLTFGDALRSWGELTPAEEHFAAARPWAERLDASSANGKLGRLLIEERFGSLWHDRARAEKDPARRRQHLRRALVAHGKSLEQNRSWAKTDSSADRLRSVAISEGLVARDFRELKDYDNARGHSVARIEVFKQRAQVEPGDAADQDIARGYGDLAAIEEDAGDLAAARQAFDLQIGILQRLAERPEAALLVSSRRDLVDQLEAVAKLEAARGEREKARTAYTTASRLAETWAAAPSADSGLIHLAVGRHVSFGDALQEWGELARAEEEFTAAQQMAGRLGAHTSDGEFDRLMVDERLGSLWRDRAQAESDTERSRQHLRRALDFHTRSLERSRGWAKTDQSADRWRSVAIGELLMARDLRDLKDYTNARHHFLARIEVSEQLAQLEPGDDAELKTARAYAYLAELEAETGDVAAGRKAQDRQIGILRRLAEWTGSTSSRREVVEQLEAVAAAEVRRDERAQGRATHAEACKLADAWATGASPDQELIDLAVLRHLYFGDALRSWGDLPQAEEEYVAARRWVERLDADTADGEVDRVMVDQRSGSLWHARAQAEKDPAQSRQLLRRALELHGRSLERNRRWAKTDHGAERQRSLAIGEFLVAQDYLGLRDYANARGHLLARVAVYSQLTHLEPGETAAGDYADSFGDLASCEEEAGDLAAARQAADKQIAVLRTLAERPAGRTSLAKAYGNRSWFDLFLGDFAAAVKDAEAGLSFDAGETWVLTNKAHGFLLAGNVEAARKIYLENAGKTVLSGKTFRQTVLDDFKRLRQRPPPKLNLAAMAKIEAELAAVR